MSTTQHHEAPTAQPEAGTKDAEVALIEKAVQRVGIKSLLNHGAGSLVYSEGVNGVSQEDLIAYTREIALHCAAALTPALKAAPAAHQEARPATPCTRTPTKQGGTA